MHTIRLTYHINDNDLGGAKIISSNLASSLQKLLKMPRYDVVNSIIGLHSYNSYNDTELVYYDSMINTMKYGFSEKTINYWLSVPSVRAEDPEIFIKKLIYKCLSIVDKVYETSVQNLSLNPNDAYLIKLVEVYKLEKYRVEYLMDHIHIN